MSFFFFNDTATTEIYTLSLHDALPILRAPHGPPGQLDVVDGMQISCSATVSARPVPNWSVRKTPVCRDVFGCPLDRKSTRLNSSHSQISYAVFCLKKKKTSSLTSSTAQ